MAIDPQAAPAERREFEEAGARLLLRLSRLPAEARAGRAAEVLDLADRMRDGRALDELGRFVDRARPLFPDDVLLRTRQAQALVDLGMPQGARDVLLAAPATDPSHGLAWSEHQGLLGRVNKQIFIDAPDRRASYARAALGEAVAAYRRAFDHDPKLYWQGINLVALLSRAEALGLAGDMPDVAAVAGRVVQALEAVPEAERTPWWQATLAEVRLALGEEDEFAEALRTLVGPPPGQGAEARRASAFALNSLHRQLAEIWDLESAKGPLEGRGAAFLGMLRGALLRRPEAQVTVAVDGAEVASGRQASAEDEQALEKTFGPFGPMRLRWWELGLRRARSVAAVCGPDGAGGLRREGTGFLLSVVLKGGGAPVPCLLTNAHVLGEPDRRIVAIRDAAAARVRFEGAGGDGREHKVAEVLWTSPVAKHDATLIRLEPPPEGIQPLPATAELPSADSSAQLFVIGHPKGDELSFSFQDNLLLDHDGPPSGQPRREGVVVLHYRTPTEPGSSGSPVMVEDGWRVAALHHAGKDTMRRLNGREGAYEANEGIALSSIAAALLAERGHTLELDRPDGEGSG